MKKRSILFWVVLVIGLGCSLALLFGRVSAERGARLVACAVSFDDVQLLSEADGRTADDWLGDLAAAGVHYLVITDENEAAGKAAAQAAGMETGRAGDTAQAGDAFLMPLPPARGVKGCDAYDAPQGDASVPLALVENYDRTGVVMPDSFDPDAWDGPMVKTLYMYDAYSYHYEPAEPACENENILFRAVTDRSMRLVVVTPLEHEGGGIVTEPEAYADMLDGLSERIGARGLTLGDAFSALDAPRMNRTLYAGAVLLAIALGVLFLCLVFPVTPLFEHVLLFLGILAAAGGTFVLSLLMQKLAAFGAAVIVPCLAALLLGQAASGRDTGIHSLPPVPRFAAMLAALLAMSIAGGLYVGALLATRQYMLEFSVFSGVKLAQLLPIAVTAVVLAAVLRRRPAGPQQRLPLPLLIVLVLGVGAALVLLVLRSGDNMIPVAKFELAARTWLEQTLYARPRTKEMLMAFPALALYVSACDRRIPVLEFPLGILASVGAVSVVNTFCHTFTPVHVSLIRTLLSGGIGFVIGLAALAVFRLLLGRKAAY